MIPIYNYTSLEKNRDEAIEIARTYLQGRGFDLSEYRSVAKSENWLSLGGFQTPVGRIGIYEYEESSIFSLYS